MWFSIKMNMIRKVLIISLKLECTFKVTDQIEGMRWLTIKKIKNKREAKSRERFVNAMTFRLIWFVFRCIRKNYSVINEHLLHPFKLESIASPFCDIHYFYTMRRILNLFFHLKWTIASYWWSFSFKYPQILCIIWKDIHS